MGEQTLGDIVLLGSGETAPSMQRIYDRIFSRLTQRPRVAILETPAGFEPNSEEVARDVDRFLRVHLQNYRPQVTTVPVRRSDGPFSTNNPDLMGPIYEANVILTGPGSPTYAVRHFRDSLCWEICRICHRLGRTLFLSSAATVAAGHLSLPVYEIYKVGLDLYWSEGLDLFAPFGLKLVVIPHWNNQSGGSGLDTSRCYMGRNRFNELLDLLPAEDGLTVLGIDENTAVIMNPSSGRAQVLGQGRATIVRNDETLEIVHDHDFALEELGAWSLPDAQSGLDPGIWSQTVRKLKDLELRAMEEETPSAEVRDWLQQRERARQAKDWPLSDRLRDRIRTHGWQVMDTPSGQTLTRLDDV